MSEDTHAHMISHAAYTNRYIKTWAQKLSPWIMTAFFIGGMVAWGHAGVIYAKAILAQQLIADAWIKTLHSQEDIRPWAWADTWPVAAIKFPRQDKQIYVLAGASGSSLAFGPGHIDGTAPIESKGTKIISGHRDTHFKPLQHVQLGDMIELQNKFGKWSTYKVTKTEIADINNGPLLVDLQRDELRLITCYPFDATIPGGPLRYVVIAEPVNATQGSQTPSSQLHQAELQIGAINSEVTTYDF